jgi:serpin B
MYARELEEKMNTGKFIIRLGSLLALPIFFAGCGQASTTPAAATPESPEATEPEPVLEEKSLKSNLARINAPDVPAEDLDELVLGNNAFAAALYREVRGREGNLFLSPYSISLAMAMLYGGARGQTEAQMADALHFTLPQDRLHPAFNALDQIIAAYNAAFQDPETQEDKGFQLDVANAIWGQDGFPFLDSYLDLLALNYGAGMQLTDFINSPEASRNLINDWVAEQTRDKITDIIPHGAIDPLTRLVLANAIYFKAVWRTQFDPRNTKDEPFHLADGSAVQAPMMHTGPAPFPYAQGDGWQAVGLPYLGGNVMMAVIMPSGDFSEFEQGLDDGRLEEILSSMKSQSLALGMPKFDMESNFQLNGILSNLGMTDAFTDADFSGIDGQKDLSVSDVIHQAFVKVDEVGTEAAAATIAIMGMTSGPTEPLVVTIDHPFLFLIYDAQTHTILFLGRCMNPVA